MNVQTLFLSFIDLKNYFPIKMNSSNKYYSTFLSFESNMRKFTNNYFNIISINIRSISSINKFNNFRNTIASFPYLPSLICVQETWFQRELLQLYDISGYNAVHCCRNDGYGGTTIYIRNNLQYSVDICESGNFIDAVLLTLHIKIFCGKKQSNVVL